LEITPKGKEALKNIYREKENSLKEFMGTGSNENNKNMLARLREISDMMSRI
jgi:DNA-binding MarR family transcriptional regulator